MNVVYGYFIKTRTGNGISRISITVLPMIIGNYKKMFDAPEQFNKVTAEDIKRVAGKYFLKSNRTVGILKSQTDD